MMSVIGTYKAAFSEATHCLFNGHLDDPDFREVAIQRILARTKDDVTLSVSGKLPIKVKGDRGYVDLTYQGFFGKQRTTGHPFKDDKTELPNADYATARRGGLNGLLEGCRHEQKYRRA